MKIKLVLAVLILLATKAFGQLQPQFPISMPSANASNLSLYSETPVSLFTGIPEISIPLYTISDGNVKVSLGMSYHAGGVKPDVHPSWTGNGWSLQSGGTIIRKVNGIEDEMENDLGGFYDNHGNLSATDWSNFDQLRQLAANGLQADPAPDEFLFNFNGVSGMFLLDDLGNWQVKCDQDVKVVFSPTDFIAPFIAPPMPNPYSRTTYHRCFGKFTLITADGTKYIFGGTNNSIDYSIDFFNQAIKEWTATSWYLTQILSADGIHNINLNYERDQYTNVLYFNKYQNIYSVNNSTDPTKSCSTASDYLVTSYLVGGNLQSPVYLKSIETSKELVQFDRSTSIELRYNSESYNSYNQIYYTNGSNQTIAQPISAVDTTVYKLLPFLRQNGITAYPAVLSNLQWKKLDRISLKDKATNEVIKQYQFSYSNDATKRLTLKSLKESNPSGAITDSIAPYRFFYDESKQLPGYLTNATDEWGYSNGVLSYTSPIGEYISDFAYFRNVDPENLIAGVLRKIIYPTGGYKLFLFESNDYSARVNDNHLSLTSGIYGRGGGLRIKSIYDYDPFNKSLKSKKYYYTKNFSSVNQTNTISSGIISALPIHRWTGGHSLPTGEGINVNLKSRNTVLPLSENAGGSHVGYSEVAEVLENNSYTISKFTNYDDGHLDEGYITSLFPEKAFMSSFTSLALERGMLKYQAVFNSSAVRLKSTTIAYSPLRNNRTYVKATDVNAYQVCKSNSVPTGAVVYDGGAYKIYTYSYLPVSVIDSVFDHATIPVVSLINLYYDNPLNKLNTRIEQLRTDDQKLTTLTLYPQDYAGGTTFIDNLVQKNINALPIEKINYLTNPSTGDVKILSGTLTTYNAINPFVKDTDYDLETQSTINLASFKFSSSVLGSLPFNTSKLVFTKDPLYKSTATYEYDNYFNLKQVNTTDGTASSMMWGYGNSLPVAQVSNANVNEFYYNGFEEETGGTSTDSKVGVKSKVLNGSVFGLPSFTALTLGRKYILSYWYKNTGGKWTLFSDTYLTLPVSISGYTLIDELRIYPENGQMKTTSYLSPRGLVTAETNAAGQSQSYEYDGLQRLKIVRDNDKNIVKELRYAISPVQGINEVFYFNSLKTGTYQKNNCVSGRTGSKVTYAVTAGSYISAVSQTDADTQAQNDITTNGQSFANAKGTCLYYNVALSQTFYATNCTSPYLPTAYTVSVAQGIYSSDISQEDANAQAQNEITINGALANTRSDGCYLPTSYITVENFLNESVPHKELTVVLTNTVTHVQYTSGKLNENQTTTFTVPGGTYSISYTTYGFYNSLRLDINNSTQDCKSTSSSFANITITSANVKFSMGSASCPPPN